MESPPRLPPQIATETGSSVVEVREEARRLLGEITHNLQLSSVRVMAYTLSKLAKRLFSSIYVNMEGLSMVRTNQRMDSFPHKLPTTRHFSCVFNSSVLTATKSRPGDACRPDAQSQELRGLLSHLLHPVHLRHPGSCYRFRNSQVSIRIRTTEHYRSHITTPPIISLFSRKALAGFKMLGEILRRSGAFSIRRAIGSDKLYWAVLSEYVKTTVRVRCGVLPPSAAPNRFLF